MNFLFVVADIKEATPYIRHYALSKRPGGLYVGAYKNNTFMLRVTGMGMVNAVTKTVPFLDFSNPISIVNFGYVGGNNVVPGEWYICNKFYQHDFDLSLIGVQTKDPAEVNVCDNIINVENLFSSKREFISCFTGSRFVNEQLSDSRYIVDMEAYALSALAKNLDRNFLSVKLVSDTSNSSQYSENQETLMEIKSEELFEILDEYISNFN